MRVTLYLLRKDTVLTKEILRRHNLYTERDLQVLDDAAAEWRFFVRQGFDHEPRWFEHVSLILAQADAEPVYARSAGAVLLVRVDDRVFAVTFGLGFHAVGPEIVEPDFGLRVTANCVGTNGLTMADARGLGKGKRNAFSRLPSPGEMFALGLLTDEEWIRKFGGEVEIAGFAKSAAGADALQLNIDDFRLVELPGKLRQALKLYESDSYQQYFPFLDYFRRVSSKDLIVELDHLLIESMRARDPDIGFASPDEFAMSADWYRLNRRKNERWLPELRTEDVYQAIDDFKGRSQPLTSIKVEAYDLAGEMVHERVDLRSYLVASVRRQTQERTEDYAITAGAWFRIDQQYVDVVDRYLRDNVLDLTADLQLPVWDDEYLKDNVEGRYGEERYNRHVSDTRGYVLLDRKLYRGQAGERVEICDLLTPDKKLICVKRMDGSDKLSHLFQQGSVSTQMLMTNDDYRARVMSKLRELDPSAEFGSPTEWTVVYAIATSRPGALKDIMYFFSRAALRTHGLSIKGNGIRVAVARIDRLSSKR